MGDKERIRRRVAKGELPPTVSRVIFRPQARRSCCGWTSCGVPWLFRRCCTKVVFEITTCDRRPISPIRHFAPSCHLSGGADPVKQRNTTIGEVDGGSTFHNLSLPSLLLDRQVVSPSPLFETKIPRGQPPHSRNPVMRTSSLLDNVHAVRVEHKYGLEISAERTVAPRLKVPTTTTKISVF